MERVETEGQIATAHTLARILSSIPLSCEGPAKLVIYDIHTLQVQFFEDVALTKQNRFYFGDHVIPFLQSAMPEFKQMLTDKHKGEDVRNLRSWR